MGPARRLVAVLALCLAAASSAAEVPVEVKRALATRDYETAIAWLEANSGEPEAAFELGRLHRLGLGVPGDPGRAAALFEVAAAAGHREAAYLLGLHLARLGDRSSARRWMAQALDAGHQGAGRWLEAELPARDGADLLADLRSGRPPPVALPIEALSVRDESERTLLMIAAEQGAAGWVTDLVGAGIALDARDQYGATALDAALAAGNFVIAVVLIDAGADPDHPGADGSTPLHRAVAAGHLPTVRRLLKAGANPETLNDAGWSPLMLAGRSDDESLRKLFGIESKPRQRPIAGDDASRYAALSDAVRRGEPESVAALMSDAEVRRRLIAADEGRIVHLALPEPSILGVLVDAGFAAEALDEQGRSPLLASIDLDCVACVELLTGVGADPDRQDPEGRTALILAASRNLLGIAGALLGAGADPDLEDPDGRNALWWASRGGHEELAMALLDAGAVAAADRDGLGPLHGAAMNDSMELVRRLAVGGRVDAVTSGGNTALLMAAHAGATGSVAQLLAAGAAIDHRNRTGDTAVLLAVRAGHPETVERLLLAGANPRARNDQFESAVDLIAARPGPRWRELQTLAERSMLDLLGLAN